MAGLDSTTVTANVNSYGDDIDDGLAQLKDPVPDDTVVDTRTGQVWEQQPEYFCEDDSNTGVNLFLVVQDGEYLDTRLPCGVTVPTSVFDFFGGSPQVLQDQSGNDVQLDSYAPPFRLGNGGGSRREFIAVPDALSDAPGDPKPDPGLAGGEDNPADFLGNAGGIYLQQTVFWAKPDGDPMCGRLLGSIRHRLRCGRSRSE